MNEQHTCTSTIPTGEALYNAYSSRIYQRVYHLIKQREEAEDLTQEVFIRALRALPTLQMSRNLYGWLYRIATNLALDALRHRKLITWQSLDPVEGRGEATEACDPLTHFVDMVEPMRTALTHLPQHERAVLLLRASGYSYTEIAMVQGKTPSAVKSYLARARERFQHYYQSSEQEEVSA